MFQAFRNILTTLAKSCKPSTLQVNGFNQAVCGLNVTRTMFTLIPKAHDQRLLTTHTNFQAHGNLQQLRFYKQKNILKRRCPGCYFVWKENRLHVECRKHPRHKQKKLLLKTIKFSEDQLDNVILFKNFIPYNIKFMVMRSKSNKRINHKSQTFQFNLNSKCHLEFVFWLG